MCWIITIGVPAPGLPYVHNYRSTRGGISVIERHTPALRDLFPIGDHLFNVTRGGCSCGIGLPAPRLLSTNQDRMVRRYRRDGWSEAKIARALADSKRATEPLRHSASSTEPLRALRDIIGVLVGKTGGVRFFAYDESVPAPFKKADSAVSLSDFNAIEQFAPHILLNVHR